MKPVWVISDCIVSPLGESSEENFNQLENGVSGVTVINDNTVSAQPIFAGRVNSIQKTEALSRVENMSLRAIQTVTCKFKLPSDRTLFILSTTKGNISLLNERSADQRRLELPATAEFLTQRCGLKKFLVVSNACISGVMALTVAKRFLQSGACDHAVVLGVDELSHFVVSGFQSLHALSDEHCKPFDADRKGINLGEAAAAMLLSSKPEELGVDPIIKILGSGLSNDANHISGPSRTGEELCSAIVNSLKESEISTNQIDFISAHGTATPYNDEMEARAFNLAGLRDTPLNSLKEYYGHTLGAAGVLETIISIHSLLNNILIPVRGFKNIGVSQPVNVIRKVESRPLKTFLKTASGFGGCNAAIVLQKVN